MKRGVIWISRKLWEELNKERGRIKAETGREPTWEQFLKTLYDAYKKQKEGDVNE